MAQEAGAAGAVLIGGDPDEPYLQSFDASLGIRIPVVAVSGQSGAELVSLCEAGDVLVRLGTAGVSAEACCRNLAAEIAPQQGNAGEVVIFSAHLDSLHLAPGASDNLSGIVALTEVVRAIAAYRDHFVRTLRMIAFTAEECGFMGSRTYVRDHEQELDDIRFVLNLDALFDATARGIAVMGRSEMKPYVEQSMAGHDSALDVREVFGTSSDYMPFLLNGVSAARPADWSDSFPVWFHTAKDTEDKVDIDWIKSNAIVCARLLLRLLTDPEGPPAKRMNKQEVRSLIERHGVAETLRWRGLGEEI